MKNKLYFGLILILLMAIMIGYNFWENSTGSEDYIPEDMTASLTPGEKSYLEDKEAICIGISDQLAPFVRPVLTQGEESTEYEGLVIEFMNLVLSQIGKTGTYVFLPTDQLEENIKSGEIDGAIMSYHKESKVNLLFTNPVVPVKGKVAVYNNLESDNQTPIKIIDTREAASVEEAVKAVLSGKIKYAGQKIGLLGNEPALRYFIEKHGSISEFSFQNQYAFEENFCVAVDKSQSILYEIMNKAVYKIDENQLLPQLEGKWLGISYSLENKGIAESIGILFTIILASVMAAFYIFYGSNKTLYEELATRMEQVLESKNELQTTFDGVSYYMIEIDLRGKIVNVNKAFNNFLKGDSSAVIGSKLTYILNFEGEMERELSDLIQLGIRTGEEQKKELSAARKIYNFRIFPLKNAREKITKVLVTIQDVTKEKTMERQMIQDNKMVAVGQLAAGVAHEIRNPLGLIRNYCYVLKTSDGQKEKAIAVIEKAVDQSGRIIDNLLNFSRSAEHKWVKIKLESHIGGILSLQRNRALKEGIDLEINCADSLEAFVLMESLDMILINLTTNAMDSIVGEAREEKGKIAIDCSENEDEILLKVKDNGEGIPEDLVEEIFNPFFTTKEKRDGNGLGLYIVYNEIKKMNGEIFVESQVSKGTEFLVIIPKWEGDNNGNGA